MEYKEVKAVTTEIEVKKEEQVVVSQLTTKLLNDIHTEFRNVSKSFVKLGYCLYNFREDRLYKELGYKTFEAFVKAEFNVSKATAYTFITVALKFTVLTPEGAPSLTLKKEFRNYTSSQLAEMCRLDADTLAKVKPTDSVREIKKLKQSVQTSEQNTDSESSESSDKKESSSGKKTKNEKDSRVPVNRLFVGTAYSFDELKIHKPIIDKYCEEKAKKEGRSYRVEVNIIWDDTTDENVGKQLESAMNPPENAKPQKAAV